MKLSKPNMQLGSGKGLQLKLLVVESLVFVIPFLIFLYLFNKNRFVFDRTQMIIMALILLLILAGLIMLRQIFDRFIDLASSMKNALRKEMQVTATKADTDELHEISNVFDTLMHRFENTTDELGDRVYELIIIRELIEAASKSREIDELLNLLLEKVMAATHSLTGSVFKVEQDAEKFRIVATRGLIPDTTQSLYLDIKESVANHVLHNRQPLLVENIETDSRTRRPNNPKYGSPSFLAMPVLTGGQIIAVLNLAQKEKNSIYNEHDKQIATVMIGEVGFALENIMLHAEIKDYVENLQKRTDELESVNQNLNQEVEQRKQTESALNEAYADLKQTQAQLVQSGKLTAIGELAAGVAHELNQPLMVIRGQAQMLLQDQDADSEVFEDLSIIERNTKRVMRIIDHLRTFSRQSQSNFQPVDVNRMIEESFLLIEEQLRLSGIDVERKYLENLPAVYGDVNQLEQVLLNLITNARDAIEKRRSLEKDPSDQIKDEITVVTSTHATDPEWVEIYVKDTGEGLSSEVLSKIFDPFFTTKEVGKGTGLGLSISYGIIKDHKGDIEVIDTGAGGTTFCIRLPKHNNQDV